MPFDAVLGLDGDEFDAYLDAAGEWPRTDRLLASLIDAVNTLIWGLAGSKGQPPPATYSPPKPANPNALPVMEFAEWYAGLQLAKK